MERFLVQDSQCSCIPNQAITHTEDECVNELLGISAGFILKRNSRC